MNTPGQIPNEISESEMEGALHPPLAANPNTGLVFKQIIRDQLYEIQIQTPIALEGTEIEGVHKMRVAYRRLQTCFKIFKPIIKRSIYQYFRANSKEIRQLLGDIRDLDVLQENLELNGFFSDNIETAAHWRQKIMPIYQDLYGKFTILIASPQYTTFLSYLETFLIDENTGLKASPKIPENAKHIQGFSRSYLENSLNSILTDAPDYEQPQPYPIYHQLRKELKKFRYALEFFSPYLRPIQTESFIENLIVLQDHLGLLNDSVVAIGILELYFPEIYEPSGSNVEKSLYEYYSFRIIEKRGLTTSFLSIWKSFLATSPQKRLMDCFPN